MSNAARSSAFSTCSAWYADFSSEAILGSAIRGVSSQSPVLVQKREAIPTAASSPISSMVNFLAPNCITLHVSLPPNWLTALLPAPNCPITLGVQMSQVLTAHRSVVIVHCDKQLLYVVGTLQL